MSAIQSSRGPGAPASIGATAAGSAEGRLYRASWQDGSIDLVAGLAAAMIGAGWLAEQFVASAFVPALAVPAWVLLRRRLIEPRLGRVRFDPARRRRLTQAQVGIFVVGAGLLALFAGLAVAGDATPIVDRLRAAVAGLPAALLGLLALISGLALGIARFGLYALAFVAAAAAVVAMDLEPGWAILAGGVATAGAGFALLCAFLRRFPPLSNELV